MFHWVSWAVDTTPTCFIYFLEICMLERGPGPHTWKRTKTADADQGLLPLFFVSATPMKRKNTEKYPQDIAPGSVTGEDTASIWLCNHHCLRLHSCCTSLNGSMNWTSGHKEMPLKGDKHTAPLKSQLEEQGCLFWSWNPVFRNIYEKMSQNIIES